MKRIYAFFLTIGRYGAENQRAFLILVCLISLSTLSWIALVVLQNFPNSVDEYSYIYQAKTLLAGRFWNPPHPLQDFFNFTHLYTVNGKTFSYYPFGWPLLLALGMLLNIPTWLINPMAATLSLVILYLIAKRIYEPRVGVYAVLMTLVSSFFLFNSSSYFSHTSCSLFILLFAYFTIVSIDEEKTGKLLWAGFFLGWAFITRYYTALLCALPLIILTLSKPGRSKKIFWLLAGILPFILFLMISNYEITGNAIVSPYSFDTLHTHFFPIVLGRNLTAFSQNILYFILWAPPFLLFIYSSFFVRHLKDALTKGIGAIFPCLAAGCFFYYYPPGNEYGPRFYYEAFPFMILFVSSYLFKENSYSAKKLFDKTLFLLFIAGLIIHIPLTGYLFKIKKQVVWDRQTPYRLVQEQKIHHAVIFIKTSSGKIYPIRRGELLRNDLDFSNDVLYVQDRREENKKLMHYYPDKTYYVFTFDRNKDKGQLQKLDPKNFMDLPLYNSIFGPLGGRQNILYYSVKERAWRDSNPQPLVPKTNALSS